MSAWWNAAYEAQYGDNTAGELAGEEADAALDFESQWQTWNGKSSCNNP